MDEEIEAMAYSVRVFYYACVLLEAVLSAYDLLQQEVYYDPDQPPHEAHDDLIDWLHAIAARIEHDADTSRHLLHNAGDELVYWSIDYLTQQAQALLPNVGGYIYSLYWNWLRGVVVSFRRVINAETTHTVYYADYQEIRDQMEALHGWLQARAIPNRSLFQEVVDAWEQHLFDLVGDPRQ